MIAKMKARGVRCSFCGKSRSEVTDIVGGAPHASGAPRRMAGKSSFICNECVRHFNQLLASSEIKSTLVHTSNLK
jgi:transposase-like protein